MIVMCQTILEVMRKKKNNPINNNPHEQKYVYSINKYNNLYSYN